MLLALERSLEMPVFQLLVNPALDPFMESQSFRDFEHGPFMTKARMSWYWQQYHQGGNRDHQRIWAPLRTSLNGLPPAHVMTAEYDVLRDEAENYAQVLRNSGIRSSVKRYPGMIHGFITLLPDHPTSVAAMKESAEVLHDTLG
jgi:acetyl esterase